MAERLAQMLDAGLDDVHLADGFPMDVCGFARASRWRSFNDDVDYGYCALKKKAFFGFQGHLLISMTGIPVLM